MSIIFPGEKKQTLPEEIENKEAHGVDGPPMLMLSQENQSSHAMDMYGGFSVHQAGIMASTVDPVDDINFAEDVDIPTINAPPPPPPPLHQQEKKDQESIEAKKSRFDELNDLAMLGIDSDDLAAQCI